MQHVIGAAHYSELSAVALQSGNVQGVFTNEEAEAAAAARRAELLARIGCVRITGWAGYKQPSLQAKSPHKYCARLSATTGAVSVRNTRGPKQAA